ncbi:LysR family transcriptional regulator [Cupriavidus basilensis]|uniref:LysR family transcriptional regulator n=1 Tax=Cupriavidus basilensis TaxID=68895 RepID=A0ABT6B1E3_9BURK|nr:LysR family transcriptional regulator [Cupriavidus basilensis]MDF3838700.1 LysR family transcriptional regulator [Cupriavidus basilensis]
MTPSERLKGIDTFVYTADAGSFTVAAERLNLTVSAISKSVARLEARLGSRLFERTTRSVVLTEAGAAFYRTCIRVLADLEEAETVLAAQNAEPAGRLRVDLPASFGRLQVLPLLLRFAEQHPGLRPHISFTDRFVDLVDEGIDVAVRIGGPDAWPAALGHRHLGTERLIFCASPAYLERAGMPQSGDFTQHACVVYGKADGSTAPWLFADEAGQPERRTVQGRLVVGSGEAQVSAVAAGWGIAQLATWLVQDELRSGALVEVLPHLATDGLPLHLVWPRSRQLLPKVHAVLEMLGVSLRIR